MICCTLIAYQFLTLAIASNLSEFKKKSAIFACLISNRNRVSQWTSRFGITIYSHANQIIFERDGEYGLRSQLPQNKTRDRSLHGSEKLKADWLIHKLFEKSLEIVESSKKYSPSLDRIKSGGFLHSFSSSSSTSLRIFMAFLVRQIVILSAS